MTPSDERDLGEDFQHRGRTHAVRPRLVWLGLAGLLAGTVVTGIGVATGSWPLAIGGVVVLGLAGLVAVRGGFFYDIAGGSSARDVVADVRDDAVIEGPDPRDREASPAVVSRVQSYEAARRRAVEQPWTPPSPVRFAAIVLVLAGAYLVVSQGSAYTDSAEGDVAGQRAAGAGILVLLGAIRVLVAGHSRLGSGLAWVGGAAMLLAGLATTHDASLSQWSEIGSGALVVLAASVTLTRPRRPDE
jgi:hypothetical protein